MIHYLIKPLIANRYQIEISLTKINHTKLSFYLPIWIAGSYTRRDFVQHLSCLNAFDKKGSVKIEQVGLSQWQIISAQPLDQLTISYQFYARDYSVRGCYLDDTRGFFNPGSACLAFDDLEQQPHQLELLLADQFVAWQSSCRQRRCFENYQVMVDHPLMIAESLEKCAFTVHGINYEIIITGHQNPLPQRFIADVQKICQTEINLFGELPTQTSSYQFLIFATDKNFGGLEHQDSSLLMIPREIIAFNDGMPPKKYPQLLGLIAHEYFHLWNIKSMRPEIYAQGYDLKKEQPSQMLWFFEGFTAYYDNWLLMHGQLIDQPTYLNLLSEDINRYLLRQGSRYQSLAQSSFEAWTKLYSNGEDAINRSTNYYGHGALAAFMMDVFIMEQSNLQYRLADVIVSLWESQQTQASGISESLFLQEITKILGTDKGQAFQEAFQRLIHGYDPIDFESTFQKIGINYQLSAFPKQYYQLPASEDFASSDLGFTYHQVADKWYIKSLNPQSSAAIAGLSVQDELLLINQQQVTASSLWEFGLKQNKDQLVQLSIRRDGIKRHYQYPLEDSLQSYCQLKIAHKAEQSQQALRDFWLDTIGSVHE